MSLGRAPSGLVVLSSARLPDRQLRSSTIGRTIKKGWINRLQEGEMKRVIDGPASANWEPITLVGGGGVLSPQAAGAIDKSPIGDCICWGIPFAVGSPFVLKDESIELEIGRKGQWFVVMHTSDLPENEPNTNGFFSPMRGEGRLGEHGADYVFRYDDGSEERAAIKRRHHIGAFQRRWGENCFEAVAHHKPFAIAAHHEQMQRLWGFSQTRVDSADGGSWINWLWAWENPYPEKRVERITLVPKSGTILFYAISVGTATSHPLRWLPRRKAVVRLFDEVDPGRDAEGNLPQLNMDMGTIISITPKPDYSDAEWESSYNNRIPEMSKKDVLIEYTAHPDAYFHFANGLAVGVKDVVDQSTGRQKNGGQDDGGRKIGGTQEPSAGDESNARIVPVPTAERRVTIRVTESGKPVPVKLHVHGASGEYLSPVDRHRIPNDAWFEDYSADFVHAGSHYCTYISGETRIDLPLGKVYIEVSKGFEISPIRQLCEISGKTETIGIELDRVLDWRERGWVTADTHVHFLSPITALLEGSAEGVNVVNLLASQWGELQTNVGDFDGKTTWGSKEEGGDGEFLVRVGTENRQHIMGHISLLGYEGRIIAPMTTGGPNESALGDPIEVLLSEWARQCRKQGGLVVLPHFPNPRAENAASIVEGDIDGIEMTSWGNLYAGINPYSLSDWYRFLSCGYQVAAVGGTDKMSAGMAVGTVRTYAHLGDENEFTYAGWMDAVRRGVTFVTYGPLMEFTVAGTPMGGKIELGSKGGTVDVEWELASVTVPMSRVELIVNGEIRESEAIDADHASGGWSVKIDRCSWLALLVRGHYPDKPEMIAAHSSAVMTEVEGTSFFAAADALTILEQIEGAIAYMDTVGTRAETAAYKRMRMILESAHRRVHNQMHAEGYFHEHTPTMDHPEHG